MFAVLSNRRDPGHTEPEFSQLTRLLINVWRWPALFAVRAIHREIGLLGASEAAVSATPGRAKPRVTGWRIGWASVAQQLELVAELEGLSANVPGLFGEVSKDR